MADTTATDGTTVEQEQNVKAAAAGTVQTQPVEEGVDDLLLDLTAKKKKKKSTKTKADEDGAPEDEEQPAVAKDSVGNDIDPSGGAAAAEEDPLALFADMKKKKKKKTKTVDLDAGEAAVTDDTAAAEPVLNERQLLGELKGKKRRPKMDFNAFVEALGDLSLGDADEGDELDLSKAKKKKKVKVKAPKEEAAAGEESGESDVEEGDYKGGDDEDDGGITYEEEKVLNETWLGSDRDYLYRELLDRAVYLIQKNNPDMAGERRKYTMIPPQVLREGTKKTVFVNLSDLCKRMRRQPEHVIQFLFTELGTSGSVDGNGRLVIKGRFQQKQIENVLRSYILEYVTCKVCRRPDTVLTKENRLMFVQCQQCRANYSVSTIKSGFSAQIGRRKR